MNRNVVIPIGALAVGALILFLLRDVLQVALVVLIHGVMLLLPYLIALSILLFLIFVAYRFMRHQSGRPSVRNDTPQRNAGATTTGLVDQLTSHFARNQAQRLHNTLTSLPAWPITTRIQATAQELLILKQSIYRAQREGVPPTVIRRYLDNTTQAAATVWHLASTIDAIGQNQIAYTVVEAKMNREDQRLQQLQSAIKETHEGIAIVLAAGIQSTTLQTVGEDLAAFNQAIKILQTPV